MKMSCQQSAAHPAVSLRRGGSVATLHHIFHSVVINGQQKHDGQQSQERRVLGGRIACQYAQCAPLAVFRNPPERFWWLVIYDTRNVQVIRGAGGVGLLQCTVSLHIIVCVSSRTGHCEKRYPSRRDVRRTRFKGDGFCIAAATLERRSGVFQAPSA